MTVRLRDPHDAEILRLAVPALGALVAEPLYILADTAVVGRLGTEALAGLAVASSALLTGFAIFIFLAYGTTSAVARLLGAGREAEAAREAVQALWLAVLIGVVVAVGGLAASGPVVAALGAEGRVAELALTYLRISLLGVPAQLLVFAGTGYLRGLQDTRTPLVVAVGGAVGNLVLELVLIGGFGFGIGASALSTVVAQTASATVFVAIVLRATNRLGAPRRPDPAAIWRAARVGGDLLVRTVALRGALTLGTAVATRIGTVDVAAHEIAFAIWNLLALALDALAIAGQALIGRYLGAERPDLARDAGRRMLELGVGVGVVVAILLAVAGPVLPHVFSTDPEVLALGTFLLWWVAGMQPVNAVAFVLDGLLIGAGDMAFLARAMVGAAVVFGTAAAAVLALDLGIGWLWAAVALLMVARAVPLWLRWRGGRWAVEGVGIGG
ncbi:MATE family efflux transporter [Euzebya sp.]|uniref:MATE family efflux transporter n=1 Tax=Euzebya sp. TaxID=1971409 RepID=UPI00351253ED